MTEDPSTGEEPGSKPKVIITINEKWCKKCGICIAFCPKAVFEAGEFGKPLVKCGQNCIQCSLCIVRCPDLAIEIKEIKPKIKKAGV